MTKILAIDTSGEACSVALDIDGRVLETFEIIPRLHARSLLPMVHSILAEAEVSVSSLDAIAFGRGPGSFTGLRICAGVVQGLAFAADIPTLPTSSLAALAQGVFRRTGHQHILTVLDAHMAELYWASFQVIEGRAALLGDEHLSAPAQLDLPANLLSAENNWVGVGDGWKFTDQFPVHVMSAVTVLQEESHVQAQDIITLAQADFLAGKQVPAELALPVYLRGKTAWRKMGDK